jgi:hypothetical protein
MTTIKVAIAKAGICGLGYNLRSSEMIGELTQVDLI